MRHQTTLTIDDNLFVEAAELVAIQDKNQLVEMALTELIKNHQSSKKINLLDLYGIGGIREDYDYKELRCDKDNNVLRIWLKITSRKHNFWTSSRSC